MKDFGISLKIIWQNLKKEKKVKVVFLFLFNIINSFAEVISIGTVIPIVTLIIDENGLNSYPQVIKVLELFPFYSSNKLFSILFIFSILIILIGLFKYINLKFTNRLAFSISVDLGTLLYSNSINKSYKDYLKSNSSDLISDLTLKLNAMISGIFIPLIVIVNSTLLAASILAALFFISFPITISMLLIFGLSYFLISKIIYSKVFNNSIQIVKYDEKLIKLIQESLGSFREINLNNNQNYYTDLFKKMSIRLRDPQCENIIIGQAPKFLLETIGIIFICSAAIYSSLSNNLGENFFAIIAAFAFAAQRILPTAQQIYNSWSSLVSNSEPLFVISNELKNYIFKHESKSEILILKSHISFVNVSFSYSSNIQNIISNFNFKIPVGSRVGIVGKTGSGKTTLIDLFTGLLSPSKGKILIDDIALDENNRYKWKNSISNVSQNTFLSDLSIKENIAFGLDVSDIRKSKLISAAKNAQAHDFIMKSPEKYNTLIGERGVRISGGQAQRLGIARALYKERKIIVLDEATSALDYDTESKVMNSIYNSDKNVTMFIIAHRITTLEHTDIILELKDDKLIKYDSYLNYKLSKNNFD